MPTHVQKAIPNVLLSARALGGTPAYGFDQSDHDDFQNLVTQYGTATRSGLCGAMAMYWIWLRREFKNRSRARDAMPAHAYSFAAFVDTGPGATAVTTLTNAYFTAGNNWQQAIRGQATALGFNSTHNTTAAVYSPFFALAAQEYGIIIAYAGQHSHGMGYHRVGQSITFFDPNQGEVFFAQHANFVTWFKQDMIPVLRAAFGNPTHVACCVMPFS